MRRFRLCPLAGDILAHNSFSHCIVAAPDGTVLPDLLGKLPGRGFWVTSSREALDRAAAKGLFSRAARAKVTPPAELADLIEAMLAKRVVELLSLARKAGLAERLYGGAAGGPEAFSTEGLTEGLTESAVAELLRPLD